MSLLNTKSDKIESLQILRGVSFLMVFLSHADYIYFYRFGIVGVEIFFSLSGFLMAYNYIRADRIKTISFISNFRFSLHKIKKLYPLHILTMLLMLIPDIIRLETGSYNGDPKSLILSILFNIFLIKTWIPGYEDSLNGVSWFFCDIAFCYFLFPWLYQFIHRFKERKDIVLAIVINIIIQFTYDTFLLATISDSLNVIYSHPISRMFDFFAGAYFGKLAIFDLQSGRRLWQGKDKLFFNFSLLISILQLDLLHLCMFEDVSNPVIFFINGYERDLFLIIPVCILIYYLSFIRQTEPLSVSIRFLKYVFLILGNYSAYTFLIHSVALRYVSDILYYFFHMEWIVARYNFLMNLIGGMILTIIMTWIWLKLSSLNKKMWSRTQHG